MPTLTPVNQFTTVLFDALFMPFAEAPGWLSLIGFSGGLALLGLLAYRVGSNQPAIRRTKSQIRADVLAIKLFRDEPSVVLRALASIVRGSVTMLRYALVPLAIMLVPFLLIVAQLALRFQWKPVGVGEPVLVTAHFVDGVDLLKQRPSMHVGAGVSVDAPPVRIVDDRRVVWRVRANNPARHELLVEMEDHRESKSLVVSDAFDRACPIRVRTGFWKRLLFPAEESIPSDSLIEQIGVDYPHRDSWLYGSNVWIFWLIGLSYLWALLLKRWLRVEF